MVISLILNYFNNVLSFPGVDAKPCFIKSFKVFVYGTLKRNEPNHEWLTNPRNGTSTFITEAQTMKRFPLIIASKYHMPFLLNIPGRGCIIDGEIYEVNVPMLGKLDQLIDPELYSREQIYINIKMPDGTQEPMKCHVYLLNTSLTTEKLLSHRTMGKYCSNGKHGLSYIKHAGSAKPEDLEEPLKY